MSTFKVGTYLLKFTDGHEFDFDVNRITDTSSEGTRASWETPIVSHKDSGFLVTREDGSWSFAPWTALTAVDWFPAGTEGV